MIRLLCWCLALIICAAACREQPEVRSAPAWANLAPGAEFDEDSGLPSEVTDKATGIRLVLVPPGDFVLGMDHEDWPEYGPSQPTRVARPYYIGKYEVSREEWKRLGGPDPFRTMSSVNRLPDREARRYPVDQISWEEAVTTLGRWGFRLPTEVEWEYACKRGGWVLSSDELQSYAWVRENAGAGLRPVGLKKPNPLGLHDVLGNVAEYTSDYWTPTHTTEASPSREPPSELGQLRVLRGGQASDPAWAVTQEAREAVAERSPAAYAGIRVVRDP